MTPIETLKRLAELQKNYGLYTPPEKYETARIFRETSGSTDFAALRGLGE